MDMERIYMDMDMEGCTYMGMDMGMEGEAVKGRVVSSHIIEEGSQ